MKATFIGLPESATLPDVSSLLGELGGLTAEMPRPGTVVVNAPTSSEIGRAATIIIGHYPGAQLSS